MFLGKRMFFGLFGRSRLLEVAALTVAGAIGACSILNDQAASSIRSGAGLRGGQICTTNVNEYDCSDCIENSKCGAQASYGCQFFTGPICFQCQTTGGGQCPGQQYEYMPNPSFPPCFIQYTVYYPECDRSYEEADDTSCDGACS